MTRFVKTKTHHSHLKTATILKWRDCEIVTSCVYIHTCTHKQRLCPWVQENMNSACAKTSGTLLHLRSEQLNGHLLSPLLLQMKPRQYQCTCKIYLAELRVFICNTFTSTCPRNDLCAVHKVVFKWPYSAL